MRLSELLNPNAVSLRLAAQNKREALVELVGVLEAAHGFNSQGEILDRVLRREAMMTTGIGNGLHIHMSLWDEAGKPLSHDPERSFGVSATAGSFLAGIIKHMAALCAFTAPTPDGSRAP